MAATESETRTKLSVDFLSSPVWTYAYAGTRRPIIQQIRILTDGSLPDADFEVFPRVRFDFPLPEEVAREWCGLPRTIESRGKHVGEPIVFESVGLTLNNSIIGRLQEHVDGHITVEVVDSRSKEVLATASRPLRILAANQFLWEPGYLDTYAAFAIPADPFVAEILKRAREILKQRTGDSSTQGYQSENPSSPADQSRARKIVEAIYDATCSFNIAYSDPPAAMAGLGQRIRTPSQIKTEGCATCLDSTVLLAACIAQVGLEPVMFVISGHAFVGYLTGGLLGEAKGSLIFGQRAADLILQQARNTAHGAVLYRDRHYGLISELLSGRHIQPIETTTVTSGSRRTFEEACLSQNNFSVKDDSTLEGIVFVSLAWKMGITPPVSLDKDAIYGHAVRTPEKPESHEPTRQEIEILNSDAIAEGLDGKDRDTPPRVRQWKASLLDLSARNPLLKTKKKFLEIEVPASLLGVIDDQLFTPKKRLEVVSFDGVPFEWIHSGVTEFEFEKWMKTSLRLVSPSYRQVPEVQRDAERVVANALQSGELKPAGEATALVHIRNAVLAGYAKDLRKKLSAINDEAKETMLETGVNSLYLALGAVEWTERKETAAFGGKNQTTVIEWRAPLYLYPVILEGGRGSPHTLRLDPQGDVTPNYCLHEKLRREPYKLDLPELVNPEEDEKGLDFDKMIKSISARLQQAKLHNFAVKPSVALGVFDYSTFRLWKDLAEHWQDMADISPVARHLILTPNQPFLDQAVTPTTPLEPLTPIAADDSQRAAIQMALDGKSFRLEGPPGTGKSQTITNLLASCLAHGKKVLFVAEKQTALDAVKKRLDACGLGDFCLNLHAKGDSDTRMRRNISDALTTALEKNIDPEDSKWQELDFTRKNTERKLNEYRDGVHNSRRPPLTPWNIHEDILELGIGEIEELPVAFVETFVETWPVFRGRMQDVADHLDAVGDPREHIWRFVETTNLGESERSQISVVLKQLFDSYRSLEVIVGDWLAASDRFTSLELKGLADVVELQAQGMLASIDQVERLKYQISSDYGQALREGSREDRAAAAILSDCRALAERIAPVLQDVSDLVIENDLLSEAQDLVNSFRQMVSSASVDELRVVWQRLAADYKDVSFRTIQTILADSSFAQYEDALRAYDGIALNDPLRGIQSECDTLQAEVKTHIANVAPTFLLRNDHLKIGLLLTDVENGSMLNRGRRTRALRESLAADALTEDDRLLQLSLKAMLALAEKVGRLNAQVASEHRGFDQSAFRAWEPASFANLLDYVKQQRIVDFKLRTNLQDSKFAGDEFVSAVRTSVELARRSRDAKDLSGGSIGGVRLEAFSPWAEGEFDRFITQLTDSVIKDLRKVLGAAVLTSDDNRLLESVILWFEASDSIKNLQARIKDELLPGVTANIRPWLLQDVEILERAAVSSVTLKSLLSRSEVRSEVERLLNDSRKSEVAAAFYDIYNGWEALARVFTFDARFYEPIVTTSRSAWVLGHVPRLIRDAGAHDTFVELDRWLKLRHALEQISILGLRSSADKVLYEGHHPSAVSNQIRRSAIRQMLRELLRENQLDRFDRKGHDRRIAEFEASLKASQTLLKQRIPGLVNQRRRTRRGLLTGSKAGATQSLIKGLRPKRGERTPIRDLIMGYGEALSDALPCFLMSPDSVARLVPLKSIEFDLVVFDEASQIRTSHAIGAVGRGKACVVVGDSRQMPPTTAFSSNTGTFIGTDDDEQDESDQLGSDTESSLTESDEPTLLNPVVWESAKDAESILEEFEEADLPYLQLLCHYRSRDEVLIAFSNLYIYDQPMLTFPSIYGLDSLALQFIHVDDGKFNRGGEPKSYKLETTDVTVPARGTNYAEAVALCEEVMMRLNDPQRRKRWLDDASGESESIIVVTFNMPQMRLVGEMLKDMDGAAFEEAVSEGEANEDTGHRRPPRLKIRNLENVQGDEADSVIFSVAFSRNEKGTFPLNWGPVTQTGGERRLNVAVTRARREMMVFCSFLPEEMTAGGKTLSRQAELVQRFLKLAVNGPKVSGDLGIGVSRSRHIDNLAATLRERGYRVQTQLGLSKLRVDVAVSRADHDEWELAILVDDPSWAERGSAFQRDILPKQVLPGLGWRKVLRVWLPAWVNEPDAIIEDIEQFFTKSDEEVVETHDEHLEAALESSRVEFEKFREQNDESSSPETAVARLDMPFEPFEVVEIGSIGWLDEAGKSRKAKERVVSLLTSIIETEGPIELERLARLACNCLGLSRVPVERLATMKKLVPATSRKKDKIGTFCWPSDKDPEDWEGYRTSHDSDGRERKIQEISVREFGNALVDTVDRATAIDLDDAMKEVARIFGFKALTAKTAEVVEVAFKVAISDGRVKQSDSNELRL